MSKTTIRTATESERARLLAALVSGFISDPVARWCWPDSESYLANMGRFANAYGGKAFDHGTAWTDDDIRGGALWLPPGEHPDEEELGGLVASTVHQDRQPHLFAALEELGSYHPEQPHWFLPMIAVDAAWHGNGIGSNRASQHPANEAIRLWNLRVSAIVPASPVHFGLHHWLHKRNSASAGALLFPARTETSRRYAGD